MRIVAADIEPYAIRFRRALTTARGTLAARRGFRLRLVSDTALVGMGEASPAYWLGEDVLAATERDLRVVTELAAASPTAAVLRAATLDTHTAPPLSQAAAHAVDTALLDLVARDRGTAVCALLGGDASAALAASMLIPDEKPHDAACAAEAAVVKGFHTLKLKVGGRSLSEERRRIAAVREAVGTAPALRIDANRAWTLAEAERTLAAVAQYGIEFVEEPLRAGGPDALAALAAATAVPIAVDESIRSAADLHALLAVGIAPILVLKPARVGGPTRALALARTAEARGLRVVVTDSIETAVGMGAAAHLAAALRTPRAALGLGGAHVLDPERHGHEAFASPSLVAAGPGLGVRQVANTTGARSRA